jgi:hypothetical protein
MSEEHNKIKRSYLSFVQVIAVKEKLDEVLIKHEDGTCEYIGVDNDETIAASFEFPCTKSNVIGVREQVFGKLTPKKTKTSAIEDRLIAVERDLADLRKLYNNLPNVYEPKMLRLG